MEVRYSADPVRFSRMTTAEVRDNFLAENLFSPGQLSLIYGDVDRAVVGSVVPLDEPVCLSAAEQLRSQYFCQRREVGVLNIGQTGKVTVDGQEYEMAKQDVLYIAKGSKEISFVSASSAQPAMFYILSYPAHKSYTTKHIKRSDVESVTLGSLEESNKRTIYKYICPSVVESCQLVMGVTELETGCVWNTMPPHTHERRMEIYLYFDVDEQARVFHLMGKPDETKHIVVADKQAVISPSWSIHSGVGTQKYTFCWGMGGENQDFDDMDHLSIEELK